MVNKKFWSAVFTLSGTIIGAGILGLPYVFSKAGFFVGLFWVLILSIILIYVKLCLGEVSLRTKTDHQLVGYAKKYLSKKGRNLIFFSILFGIYSALIAYLIGEGESLSKLFTGNIDYAVYFGVLFWFLISLLLKKGIRELKKIETWGVLGIIIIIFSMLIYFFPKINYSNFTYFSPENFFLPFGITFFALLGFSSIPEMKLEIGNSRKHFKSAIILGGLIPAVLYIIFSFIFIGVLGNQVSQIATLEFGKIVTLLGIFTMMTSYFVLSFSLRDVFIYDFSLSKKKSYFLVVSIPLIFYLLITFFNFLNFISILSIAGVISGGIFGISTLIMNKKAKKKGNRKPEYSMSINWIIIIILSILFITSMVFQFLELII